MDVPKITTDCPECKPLLQQQQAIIDRLVKQVELLTARLEKVEREGKRQAAPFRKKRQSRSEKSLDARAARIMASTIAERCLSRSTRPTMFRCRRAALTAGTIN